MTRVRGSAPSATPPSEQMTSTASISAKATKRCQPDERHGYCHHTDPVAAPAVCIQDQSDVCVWLESHRLSVNFFFSLKNDQNSFCYPSSTILLFSDGSAGRLYASRGCMFASRDWNGRSCMCLAFRSNQSNETSVHRQKNKTISQWEQENSSVSWVFVQCCGLYNTVCHHSADSDWMLLCFPIF